MTQYVQFVYWSRSRLQFRFLPIYLLARARLDSGTGPQAHQKTDPALWHGQARFSGQPDRTRSHGEARRFRAVAGYGKVARLAQQECAKAAEAGAKIISLSDPEYPRRLKEIYDPPVILFVKGNVEVLAQPGIAMVGTRHPTPYGSGMAERLSTGLAARGLVIISGMARGIDTASHRGAIAAKGKNRRRPRHPN